MDRRTFITGGLALLAAPLAADAQQAGKVARIGLLSPVSPPPPSSPTPVLDAFRQGLRELGWIEGRNLAIAYRYAEGRMDRFPELAAEFVSLKVDVIVVSGFPAARAATRATSTVPIVMAYVADPVGTGLVASLARPGGNLTGLASFTLELEAKRLELLKEAVPKLRRVAYLWNAAIPEAKGSLRDLQVAARTLGVRLQSVEVRGPEEFESGFTAMIRKRAEGLLVLADPFTVTHQKRIVDLAAKNRLPLVSGFSGFAEAGGLMSYQVNLPDLFHRAAAYVDKILKGAKPADLPVEQPSKFELIINLKTAEALGLTIPPSILVRADRIIE